MIILEVLIVFFVLIIAILGIETITKFKKSEGKLIEDVRKPLIVRINILISLIVILAILSLINIIIKV